MSNMHLFDEDLLLFADREGSARQATRVRDHLADCPVCRERMKQLQKTLASFVAAHEESVAVRNSLPAGARSRLKAALLGAAEQTVGRPALSPAILLRQFVAACAAFALVAGTVWMARDLLPPISPTNQFAAALPRKALTPGATRPVGLDQLCAAPGEEKPLPIDPALEQQVFREYGLPVSSRPAYELDYLITPELGGATDARNLWPEPYSSTAWNAHVKDELEDHLHGLVCQGRLPLETAQQAISGDWIAAYKWYFHTDAPLANAATLSSPASLGAQSKEVEVSGVKVPAF